MDILFACRSSLPCLRTFDQVETWSTHHSEPGAPDAELFHIWNSVLAQDWTQIPQHSSVVHQPLHHRRKPGRDLKINQFLDIIIIQTPEYKMQ